MSFQVRALVRRTNTTTVRVAERFSSTTENSAKTDESLSGEPMTRPITPLTRAAEMA